MKEGTNEYSPMLESMWIFISTKAFPINPIWSWQVLFSPKPSIMLVPKSTPSKIFSSSPNFCQLLLCLLSHLCKFLQVSHKPQILFDKCRNVSIVLILLKNTKFVSPSSPLPFFSDVNFFKPTYPITYFYSP